MCHLSRSRFEGQVVNTSAQLGIIFYRATVFVDVIVEKPSANDLANRHLPR